MKDHVMRIVLAITGIAAAMALSACSEPVQPENEIFRVVRDNDAARLGQYLAEGGDPNLADNNGDTLLYLATGARGGLEVTDTLILGGADVNLPNKSGRTALHNAAGWCSVNIVSALLEAGANIYAVSEDGQTVDDAVCARPADRRETVLTLLNEAQ